MSKNRFFDEPHPPLRSLLGGPRQNFSMKLTPEKLEGCGTVWWKLRDPSFNRFWLIHPCDGRTDRQTDRQTDGIAMAYTRYSYAVARKNQVPHFNCPDNAVLERNKAVMLCRAPSMCGPVSSEPSSTCCSIFFIASSNLWRLAALL